MTSCHPSPFPEHVLREADSISPHRRTSTDGICADQRHLEQGTSDHIPDARGIPHAVDISVDPPTFDPRDYLGGIVARRDARVKYIVANFSGWHGQPNTLPDVIWDPAVSLAWRQNGSFKRDHATSPHVHVSFTVAAENSTAPFFIARSPGPINTSSADEENFMLVQPHKVSKIPGRECTARLNVANRCVDLFNGAAIAYDQAGSDGARHWQIGARAGVAKPNIAGTPLGMAALPDGSGIVVTMSDHGTFIGRWS